jgi:hypothetical protein
MGATAVLIDEKLVVKSTYNGALKSEGVVVTVPFNPQNLLFIVHRGRQWQYGAI